MVNKTIKVFSYLIAGLTFISCLISIGNNGIYKDGPWANAQWLGQDIVTLFLATPLLLLSHFQGIRRDLWKWNLVLGGVLFYFVYTYAFYMFAAKLTFLYLFHLPIFGLSLFGFILILMEILNRDLNIENKHAFIKRIVIGYLLMIAAMLIFLWLADIISHLTISGHRSDTPDGQAPMIIYSLDLGIVIPLMILAAVGYWRKWQTGCKLTGIMLAKTSLLGFALMGMSLSMYLRDLSPDTFLMILWCTIGIIGTIITVLYLRQLNCGNNH